MGYQYYHINYGKPEHGSRIDNLENYEQILQEDRDPIPPIFQKRGPYEPASRYIPYDRYIDPKYIPLEVENIWKKQWQVACRAEDIPNVGDRLSYDIVDMSFVIVRSGPDEIRAFYNSCRHRGRKLCEDRGSGKSLQCAFHGWVYGLDGSLEWIPFEQQFANVDKSKWGLVEVRVALWGGNVFINPDPDAPPLEKTLGPLSEHFKDCPQGDRYTALHIRKKVRCNWKAAQEAFDEGYHVVETHSDGMPMFGSAITQYDVWEEGDVHLSRLVTPGMVVDPYIRDRVDSHEGLRVFCSAYGFDPPPADRGNTPADARRYAAECKRKLLEDTTGTDYSSRPVCHLIDMAKYHLFPNHHIWWGEALPWWYRFLPIGRSADESVMEVRLLMPNPKIGKPPPAASPIDVDFDEKCADYPETGPLGHLVDQDMGNMVAVQKGFKAAATGKGFLTLAPDVERQICHFHEVYDKVMGITGQP